MVDKRHTQKYFYSVDKTNMAITIKANNNQSITIKANNK